MFLSICIPTYRGKFLPQTLESIAQQNYLCDDVEVILSDNDSPDNLHTIYTNYTGRIKNLSYYKNDTNIGGLKNILHCTRYAQGVYTWILGDDDILFDENTLSHIIDGLKSLRPSLFYGTFDWYTNDMSEVTSNIGFDFRHLTKHFYPNGKEFLHDFRHVGIGSEFFGFISSVLFRTELITQNPRYEYIYTHTHKYLFPHFNLLIEKLDTKSIFLSPIPMIKGRLSITDFPGHSDHFLGPLRGRYRLYLDNLRTNTALFIRYFFALRVVETKIKLIILSILHRLQLPYVRKK